VAKSAESKEMSLFDAIVKGMSETASKATAKLLETTEALEIIDKHLIPALDVVGKGFEEKRLFLPQLLMSADAAKAAFDTIRFTLEKKGKSGSSKSKIVIATVKGDIHDIGKNIVKVLLQNYGFDVIDLGKDVSPDLIVETVLHENVKLVGLSALMTTTVVNMEETIKKLREKWFKLLCNGWRSSATQEYADMIGADFTQRTQWVLCDMPTIYMIKA
jgi:5-methyltetrahydrofolate--homocysteine methyltransferase